MLKVPTQTPKQSLKTKSNNHGTTAKIRHKKYPKLPFMPRRKPDADRSVQDSVDRCLPRDLSPKTQQTAVFKNMQTAVSKTRTPKLISPISNLPQIINK